MNKLATAILCLSLATAAGAGTLDQHLSTTLFGSLEPGGEPRLAVSWDGPAGALLDVWADLDGNGEPGRDELVIDGRRLAPGIEVVELELPAEALEGAGPELWVRARERRPSRAAQGAEAKTSLLADGCAWQPGFGIADLGDFVYAMAVYDDGTGPALYVGGEFRFASGLEVNNVARWDGSDWSALRGPSGPGVDLEGGVWAMAVYNDGTGPALYVGGTFATAGGVSANNIARWDGNGWSALSGPSGNGLDAEPDAMAVYDDGTGEALYVCGYFTTAGGVTVNGIARWDGSAWSELSGPSGTGMDRADVLALAVYDEGSGPALFAGGSFTTAGGVTVNNVARWDGSAWSELSGPSGTGVDLWIDVLAVYDDGGGSALYAGGNFTTAGGVTVNKIARWDGSAWSALSGPSGTGADSGIYALAAFDDGGGAALYVGGEFTTAGGVTVNHVAMWDGSTWSELSGPSGTGADSDIYALAAFDDGGGAALYAGGFFTAAGGVIANSIAMWDGSAWSAVGPPAGSGVNDPVAALAVHDDGNGPVLYAGGSFKGAGGVTVNGVAKWDGSAWSALSWVSGTGVDGGVTALAVHDDGGGPALYAGGYFSTAGGITVNNVAKWDGSAWSDLSWVSGTGTNGQVIALAVHDDGGGPALYAGGYFSTAGGITVNNVAKWDGSAWSDLSWVSGTGTNGQVIALAVHDDGGGPALYAGGSFSTAGGITVNNVAKWDGSAWSELNGPSSDGTNGYVSALAVHDDGGGPALYAGGGFTTAGGVTVNRVARWDGSDWSALIGPAGTGISGGGGPRVSALAAYNNGAGAALYAGGSFLTAGGLPSNNIAAWRCYSDLSAPTNPTALSSTTHTAGQWSAARVVSVLFDNAAATEPDTAADVLHTSDPHSTSAWLPDGDANWFHLRTCDRAGNCAAGVHLGPYWIDTVVPSGPTDLVSTSHTPGVASDDPSVDMAWTAATDSSSGLDGYGWAVTGSPAWTCDQVKDLEQGATTFTTPDLADGVWWFHLCAVDNVGNWGAEASAGPYPIGAIFADGFESGDTAAWSAAVGGS